MEQRIQREKEDPGDMDARTSRTTDCVRQVMVRDELKVTLRLQTCMRGNRSISARIRKEAGIVCEEEIVRFGTYWV